MTRPTSASIIMTATAPQLEMPACDYAPRKYEGPSKAEILAMRRQFTNPAIFTIYMEHMLVVDGHMQ